METKYVNECNEEIPDYIVSRAIELGCINHLYIYKEGKYGGKFPKASIGCSKATHFRNATNAESMKVPLGDGWVAFKSPSEKGSHRNRFPKSSSKSKAEKHTSILCQIEDIVERMYHNKFKTYLTTHTRKYYKETEKESRKTFYHLKMYTTDPPKGRSNVKDPDSIVVEGHEIRYVIEVKWGSTDLKSIFDSNSDELTKIKDLIRESKVCRVIGPYIQNGIEVNENEKHIDFKVCSNTRFLVVSDLRGLLKSHPADFGSIKRKYKDFDNLFSICDIKEDVETFYSLDTFLKENQNKNKEYKERANRNDNRKSPLRPM
ncbi:MAG: hypothetical protein KAU16_04115 [Methanophagales archaeon]|nr:hypothetical protein [Methanophagales archaeon]